MGEVYFFEYGQFNNNPSNGGIYPVFGANGIIGYYSKYNAENSIIIGHMGEYAGSVLWGEGKHFVTYNGTITLPKLKNIIPKYGYYMLLRTDIRKTCGGSGLPFLSYEMLQKLDFQYPKNCEEQIKIKDFLEKLDNLITLHQRKLEKLKNIKKSMLEKMFPKNGSNIPEIRFKGFTDAWEQRKLGEESTDIVAGGDINKLLICDKGQYPVIANALNDEGIVGYYANQYRIKAPAVTITGRGEVGFAKARTVNFTPVVRLLSVKSNHDVFYLENAINTLKIIIESTGVPQLTVPQIAKYEIYFPSNLKEEQLIGNLFFELDNLITLHQRKLEKLQNIKKACLEKMFV